VELCSEIGWVSNSKGDIRSLPVLGTVDGAANLGQFVAVGLDCRSAKCHEGTRRTFENAAQEIAHQPAERLRALA
jgi:hypothetical protein